MKINDCLKRSFSQSHIKIKGLLNGNVLPLKQLNDFHMFVSYPQNEKNKSLHKIKEMVLAPGKVKNLVDMRVVGL